MVKTSLGKSGGAALKPAISKIDKSVSVIDKSVSVIDKSVSVIDKSMSSAKIDISPAPITQRRFTLRNAMFVSRAIVAMRGAVTYPSDLSLLAQTALTPSTATRPVGVKECASQAGVRRTITFTGCGGLYTYLFGVAAYMQQHFTWDPKSTAFASASAGAFPAFLLSANIDVERFHRTSNRRLIEAVAEQRAMYDGRTAPLGIWNDAVREHFSRALVDELGSAGHAAIPSRHYISLTELPARTNELLHEYASVEDLVEGFIASAYVPIYDNAGRLAASWRGRRFIDGGASDNAPKPFGDDVPALVLSPHMWRQHHEGAFAFVCSDWEWVDTKFELGKQDAAAHHDELAAFFEPKS